jgi:hypothetical protein
VQHPRQDAGRHRAGRFTEVDKPMSRKLLAAALLLGLAAAPALAQTSPAGAPEDSTAARTMAQNRRVSIGQQPAPAAGGQAPAREAAAKEPPRRAGPPAVARPVALADRASP